MPGLIPLVVAGDPTWEPSRYMPDVRVEIAFNAGYTTPAASRVWTDVSEWVELHRRIKIDVGRRDERSTADANKLSLTLDNSDGRFTAGRAASPYYPNVKLGRPIRVSVMTVTGHTSVRFRGYVDQWPTAWEETDAYASADVTAASRLARLGFGAQLRSAIEETILEATPWRYWTLGDAKDSITAAESSGNGGTPAVVTLAGQINPADETTWATFGEATGPGTDDLTALQLRGSGTRSAAPDVNAFSGEYLYADHGATSAILAVRTTCLADPTKLPQGSPLDGYAYLFDGLGDGTIGLTIDENGFAGIRLATTGAAALTSAVNIGDNQTHDLVLVLTPGSQLRLYVDGVSVGTAATSITSLVGPGRLCFFGRGVYGTISHLALYATAPSAGQIADQAEAVLGGFAGERTDERLVHALSWVGVDAADIDADAGAETMTYQKTSGQTVLDVLRDIESTESGILFDKANGQVGFHSRSRRYTAAVEATLDMAAQQVGADFEPKLDRSALANDATVDNPTTGESARYVDVASRDEYGVATTSDKVVGETFDALLQKAYWLTALYAQPRSRVPSLTVNVLAHVNDIPSAETILGLTVSSRIQTANQPAQADSTTGDYFVEGYTEELGPESYEITLNLSPTQPYVNTFILDSATRGLLDTNVLGL